MTLRTTNKFWSTYELAVLGAQISLLTLSLILGVGCGNSSNVERSPSVSPKVARSVNAASNADASSLSFSGSVACAECHAATAAEYHSHPMSRSLSSMDNPDLTEDVSNPRFTTGPGLAYLVEKDKDHTWHHEIRFDSDKNVVYDQRVMMDYAVGSGVRGRSYLTNTNGRLYQSPITWYTAENHWGLSPGYSEKSHPRFDRKVTHACLACHAGRVNLHPTDPDRFADRIFAEGSIGCERCHGPGATHIAYHKMGQSTRAGADPIVNPERFKDSRRDAVCNQCHLQGRRRVTVNGHGEFDFQPGMHLSDVWTVILKTEGIKDGVADAVSQVEQMYSSQCFQKSNGELSCISCHDPHRFPSPPEVTDHYRKRCLQCHSGSHLQCSEDMSVRLQNDSDSCIKCHMPKFGAADVHSAQSDHRILRRPPLTSQVRPVSNNLATSDDFVFFEEPGVTLSKATRDRAAGIYSAEIGYLNNSSAAAQHAVKLLSRLQRNNPDDLELSFSMGKALIQTRKFKDAMDILEALFKTNPTNEDLLETLATTYHEHGRLNLARDRYERLLKMNPARARYYGRYSHVLAQLEDYQGAIEAGETALKLDPSLVQAHAFLAEVCETVGDKNRAAYHKRMLKSFKTIPAPAEK